jgi:4-hydroxybenzoyl-CoA thioesterase
MIGQISYEFDVVWGDCDPAGIVFYPAMFRWFDIGTHMLMSSSGFSRDRLFSEYGIIGPGLVSAKCDFKRPITYGDRLIHRAAVSHWGTRSFAISHALLMKDEIVAEGTETRICITRDDQGRYAAIAIPAPFRAAVESLG